MTTNGQIRTEKPHGANDTEGYRVDLGTSGRTRTGTLLRARDFESRVSTNSTTLAFHCSEDGQGDKPLPLQSHKREIIAVTMSGSTDLPNMQLCAAQVYDKSLKPAD